MGGIVMEITRNILQELCSVLEMRTQGGDGGESGVESGVHLTRLATGDTLFTQGEPGDSVYIVASGQIDIKVAVPGEDDRILCTLKRNAVLGEMSLLLDEPRSATATARTDAVLWQIPRDEFQAAISRGDRWTNNLLLVMLQMLARRLADMNQELISLMVAQHEIAHSEEAEIQAINIAELERLRQRLFTQWSF